VQRVKEKQNYPENQKRTYSYNRAAADIFKKKSQKSLEIFQAFLLT